jgi:ATP-dependent DNA ligase
LDGELVVWDTAASRLDFTALQRRVIAPTWAARYAREQPAAFVAFDILVDAGVVLSGRPLRDRRRHLEQLVAYLAPPLRITPATRDVDLAGVWLQQDTDADVGIEGLVVKGLADVYQPGRRGWLKVKARRSADVVVGAVTGTLIRPERLILGLPDPATGQLIVAGATGPLTRAQQALVGPLLRAPAGEHPWPPGLPSGRLGGPRRLPVALADPVLVVEVDADSAFEYGRWRHLTRFRRTRPDLDPGDVSGPV